MTGEWDLNRGHLTFHPAPAAPPPAAPPELPSAKFSRWDESIEAHEARYMDKLTPAMRERLAPTATPEPEDFETALARLLTLTRQDTLAGRDSAAGNAALDDFLTCHRPQPAPVAAAPSGAREETLAALEQVLRDVNWSLVFDCLQYETFTPHAREVLRNAPETLASLRAALRGTP
jgi:hypothetical protein